ncbi:MAG: histidine phosphatase family protein [Paracoccaceae bacterium]
MTRIALLRHFPTDWNGERRLQGRIDRPLTEASRARLATLALPAPWDTADLVASTLARAGETAALLAAAHGRPPEAVRRDDRLVEVSWGDWEGRAIETMPVDPATGRLAPYALGWEDHPPNGESLGDALARVRPALAALDEPTVVVTHKALMRAVLREAHGHRPDIGEIEIKRGRLYPLTIGPGGTACDPEPAARLVAR